MVIHTSISSCHTSSSTDITPVQYGKSRSRETPALPMYHSDIWTMHENSLPHLAADSIDNVDILRSQYSIYLLSAFISSDANFTSNTIPFNILLF